MWRPLLYKEVHQPFSSILTDVLYLCVAEGHPVHLCCRITCSKTLTHTTFISSRTCPTRPDILTVCLIKGHTLHSCHRRTCYIYVSKDMHYTPRHTSFIHWKDTHCIRVSQDKPLTPWYTMPMHHRTFSTLMSEKDMILTHYIHMQLDMLYIHMSQKEVLQTWTYYICVLWEGHALHSCHRTQSTYSDILLS